MKLNLKPEDPSCCTYIEVSPAPDGEVCLFIRDYNVWQEIVDAGANNLYRLSVDISCESARTLIAMLESAIRDAERLSSV